MAAHRNRNQVLCPKMIYSFEVFLSCFSPDHWDPKWLALNADAAKKEKHFLIEPTYPKDLL